MNLENYNPLKINIDKKVFLKIFIISILFLSYQEFVQLTFLQDSFPTPVLLLKPLLTPWFVTLSGIVFFISCIIVLKQNIASRMIRFLVFGTFFILVAASGSFGLVNHANDSILVILLFLALLPTEEFSNTDNATFNKSMLYAIRLSMLFYTISGIHKFRYLLSCVWEKGCMANTSFLDYHIFSNALIRKWNLPFEAVLANISSTQANIIFILLSLLEFSAFFATFSRPALKVVLSLLILMHLGALLLMNIHFLPFVLTHTIFLVFFLNDSMTVKSGIAGVVEC